MRLSCADDLVKQKNKKIKKSIMTQYTRWPDTKLISIGINKHSTDSHKFCTEFFPLIRIERYLRLPSNREKRRKKMKNTQIWCPKKFKKKKSPEVTNKKIVKIVKLEKKSFSFYDDKGEKFLIRVIRYFCDCYLCLRGPKINQKCSNIE